MSNTTPGRTHSHLSWCPPRNSLILIEHAPTLALLRPRGEHHESQGCPRPAWRLGGIGAGRCAFAAGRNAGSWVPKLPVDRAVAAFREGLADFGYAEGRNVKIEFRWANAQFDKLPALAEELVRQPVMVVGAVGGAQTPR